MADEKNKDNKPEDNKPEEGSNKPASNKPEGKTKFYKLIYRTPKEQKGEKINQNPRISEDGGIYETGDVIELTASRLKSLGSEYFKELTDAEYKAWEDSGRSLKFLPEKKK